MYRNDIHGQGLPHHKSKRGMRLFRTIEFSFHEHEQLGKRLFNINHGMSPARGKSSKETPGPLACI